MIADILQKNNPDLSRYEALPLSRFGLFTTESIMEEQRTDAKHFNDIGRGTKTEPSTQIKC